MDPTPGSRPKDSQLVSPVPDACESLPTIVALSLIAVGCNIITPACDAHFWFQWQRLLFVFVVLLLLDF
jgi:hypothetical protein